MLPKELLIKKNFAVVALDKRGQVDWNSLTGPRTLTSKSLRMEFRVVAKVGVNERALPALAMMTSILLMYKDCSVLMMAVKSVSALLSRRTGMTLLFAPAGVRPEEIFLLKLATSRTVAIMVVLGRERSAFVSAKPIPYDQGNQHHRFKNWKE